MKRYLHNASHEVLTTFNQGQFIPIMAFKGVPSETVRLKSDLIIRTQPLLAPVYAKCKVVITHYAIPLRLLQTNFQPFRTGGADGESTVQAPYITAPAVTGFAVGSLADYLGMPTGVPNLQVDAFPFRAYNLVWNKFIRDKDLQTAAVISLGDGADTTTETELRNICWERDNFTSARPYPQKGDAVSIPLTGDAPVKGIGPLTNAGWTGPINAYETDTGLRSFATAKSVASSTDGNQRLAIEQDGTTGLPNIRADLSDVSAVDIEDLRLAASIQRFKEFLSRFVGEGTLTEFYRMFNVAPQDMRMQWPERLGSSESVIQFSEVLQTAEGTDPVGELRGHGIGAAKGRTTVYTLVEDAIIMSFVSVKPKTIYMQGLDRQWSMTSRYDYYLPMLANLGQQPVLNKEVDADHSSPNGVFGYQDQYYWFRRLPSRVSGEFRDTLDYWHMARKFDTPPALNGDFVEANPTDRIYSAGAAHQLQVRVWNSVKRKSPVLPEGRPLLK